MTPDEKQWAKQEKDLRKGAVDFYKFSLSLIDTLTEENRHLQFAAVNMQIALELWLKYYFLCKGMPERVFFDNGKKFKDFSAALNSYYSLNRSPLIEKGVLQTILKTRNDIVHAGRSPSWNNDLIGSIISCVFFMQHIAQHDLAESLLLPEYHPHKLSRNHFWREGALSFSEKLSELTDERPWECPFCYNHTLFHKWVFAFDDYLDEDDLQCLTCLVDIDLSHSGTLIKCPMCFGKSYYLDVLNVQRNQLFCGKCLACGGTLDFRRCASCEKFYCPSDTSEETVSRGKYYCSTQCLE